MQSAVGHRCLLDYSNCLLVQTMKSTRFTLSLIIISFISIQAIQPTPATAPTAYVPDVYTTLPLGAIRPQGWLHDQLVTMSKGTTGHLDEVHDKIKKDNGWLGGQGDGWEETPYWLDGALPLAYLIDDEALKAKVLRYVNWTIDHQRKSGYFGPITKIEREQGIEITPANADQGEDWWPKMVMLKVIQQYYLASRDKRVIPFMTKYFNYQKEALKKAPIGQWTEWAQSRGAENVMMAQWLYGITKDKSLLELASRIEAQSFPWSKWLGSRDWVMDAAANQNGEQWMTRHAVNVGMALKSPALNYQRTGNKAYLDTLKTGFRDLMTLHGLPFGIFSGDEDLHGNAPTQGTELCAIVESMYSLEEIIAISGDPYYMDALERMTFNAMPQQTTDDYNEKQYFQIANQVQISRGVFDFSLPFSREMNNVLGMRSGYTCCLANMHQGWTKFASHLWYGTKNNGIAALEYSPNTVTAKLGAAQTEVIIQEKTSYPFSDRIDFELATPKDVAFPFQLRIPAWCTEATISLNGKELRKGKSGQIVTLNRTWKSGDLLTLQLPMKVTTTNWAKNSRVVERGPLVYALKLEEKWEKGHDEVEGDYYSVFPKSPWNYGLLESVVQKPSSVQVTQQPVAPDFVWNLAHAPIELTTEGRKIPGWVAVEGVAYQPVSDRGGTYRGEVSPKVEKLTLVPIGFTKIRIVAFPVVK